MEIISDDPGTNKSSQGYHFVLGGIKIDWKSTVQRTIRKATNEAGLLSVSLGGSKMQE